jgi:drug/metabolite transporter (DMT)-like permease
VLVSVVLLALVCTAGGFVLLAALVAEIGPVRATTVTYVNPAVALVAGAVVLGERVTAWSIAGFALVLAGCFLLAFRRPGAPPTREAPPTGEAAPTGEHAAVPDPEPEPGAVQL